MKEEESIFGTEPERLMRLMRSGLQADESETENRAKETAPAGSFPEQTGKRIGRYKILRTLGEGGMGIVFLAEQQGSIHRRVALKVIKPGMDSKRILARFEAERQALALLDHLNVANVYDAGTTEAGRPYFVMEYVKGLPITEYCDHHKLTIEERLRYSNRSVTLFSTPIKRVSSIGILSRRISLSLLRMIRRCRRLSTLVSQKR